MENALHLAIICDGNRRWARAQGLLPWDGHRKGMDVIRPIIDWCHAHPRVGTLTFWAFSTENWDREKKEVAELMRLFERFMKEESPRLIEQGVRFLHAGRKDRIPASLAEMFRDAEEKTKDFTGFTVQLAIDHGGKDEIVRALQRVPPGTVITEDVIAAHLDHPDVPEIDFIIRTSGEQRTSGFALWRATYAEWFFPTYHFPDLTPDRLEEALAEYDGRKRRFGK